MNEQEIARQVAERQRIVNEAIAHSATESGIPAEYHALIKLIAWEAIGHYNANPIVCKRCGGTNAVETELYEGLVNCPECTPES